MFAAVLYLRDNQYANLPITFVRDFDPQSYDKSHVYKAFWNRKLHLAQDGKKVENVAYLKSLTVPPKKELWNKDEGEKYYPSYIVRLADSYEELVASLEAKRAVIPIIPTQILETSSSETDHSNITRKEKEEKKKEEKAKKKNLQVNKVAKAKAILNDARKSRKDLFDTDSEMDIDPDVVPVSQVNEAIKAREFWENKYDEATSLIHKLKADINELKKENDSLKEDVKEISELRSLNRQLQDRILAIPAGQDSQIAGPAQQPENFTEIQGTEILDLGAGVTLHRQTFFDLHELPDCKKFTKNLATAIWGRRELGSKSVTGQKCRNRSGPKKMVGEKKQGEEAKKALTPEKLAVITGQMRDYLRKRKTGPAETESILKKRNVWLSDAIAYSRKLNIE